MLQSNLRELQIQYYEAVKQLDQFRAASDAKVLQFETTIAELTAKLEASDSKNASLVQESSQIEVQLNEARESTQLLEKKYHRAKKIVKELQTREQSYTRRENLYQQKLDEIEMELVRFVDCLNKTLFEDGLKFCKILATNNSQAQALHKQKVQLDVFLLVRKLCANFNSDSSAENQQIKQRITAILEQQLANIIVNPSNMRTVTDFVEYSTTGNDSAECDSTAHQRHAHAAHRLSQPNLPRPIGVAGQPTKQFHELQPLSNIGAPTQNQPSPPQSVNSYPSSNSLNSLNNNNNNENLKGNYFPTSGLVTSTASSKKQTFDLQQQTTGADDRFNHPPPDIQVPYTTDEWHDKPVSEWTTTQVSTWLLALGLDQ